MDKMDERRPSDRPDATRAAEGRRRLDPATPEVAGHAAPPSPATEAEDQGTAEEGAETEGHMFSNPYFMEMDAASRQRDAMKAADRDRQVSEAGGDRSLADRIRDRVRGRDNG